MASASGGTKGSLCRIDSWGTFDSPVPGQHAEFELEIGHRASGIGDDEEPLSHKLVIGKTGTYTDHAQKGVPDSIQMAGLCGIPDEPTPDTKETEMISNSSTSAKALALSALAVPLWASAQVAPGSVTFEPAQTGIPTLGATALVMLALVLGIFGVLGLRKGGRSAPLAFFATAVIAGTIGIHNGGVHFSRAVAGDLCTNISNPSGETLDILPDSFNQYCNQTAITMEVVAVELPASGCPLPFDSVIAPAIPCELGTSVAPGASCQIICALQTSDRRLKTEITNTGRLANGFPIYEFGYRDQPGRYLGVMAQDVLETRPDAVIERDDGYLMVDYAKLGISPVRVD